MNDEKNETQRTSESEPAHLPLAYVMQFDLFMSADKPEICPAVLEDLKSAFIAALGDIKNRYPEQSEEIRMTLTQLYKSPDLELF
jgi:hypothetical protein